MNRLEIESSKNYLKKVYNQENNHSLKKYIVSLANEFTDFDYANSTNFKIKIDDLIYQYKKSNNLICVSGYFENTSSLESYEETHISKKKIAIEKEELLFVPSQEKNISVTINSYLELVSAMKCILWSFGNNPSTIKKIFQHIYIKKNDEIILIPESDYEITNKIISDATRSNEFYVQKLRNNNKIVWLYNNPSNKRLGYFIDGKLRTVEYLSKYYDIPRTTIQSRLKKMNIENAVKK